MKLLDILARELAEWAGDVGAITQNKLTGELLDYYHCPLRGGNEREVSSIADDAGEAHGEASGAAVTRAEWQAAVDALNAPKGVEWDGVVIPPEGTVCGVWYKGCDQGECTVLFVGAEVGVFKSHAFDHEQHGDLVHYSFYKVENSAEEKDSQERKKVIAEMTVIAGGQYSPRDSIVQRLFDAGYRKEPKPCGS